MANELAFCQKWQFVKNSPSKKPIFAVKLPGARKKRPNSGVGKKRFGVF
jgi:hypothetical protein